MSVGTCDLISCSLSSGVEGSSFPPVSHIFLGLVPRELSQLVLLKPQKEEEEEEEEEEAHTHCV